MACTITSAVLTAPTRTDVYTDKAKIAYSASATMPSGSTISDTTSTSYGSATSQISEDLLAETETRLVTVTNYNTDVSYSNLVYSWVFSSGETAVGSSGTKEYVTGLSEGSANTISATVSVSCTTTTTYWYRTKSFYQSRSRSRPNLDSQWSSWSSWSPTDGGSYGSWTQSSSSSQTGTQEASKSTEAIIVYTNPGSFSEYNFTANTIIQSSDGLTAAKVDDWCDHCNALAHWYNQNTTDVAEGCRVSSGDLITAVWYNACINAIPTLTEQQKSSYHVTGGASGDIITAARINLLGTLIS